MGQLLLQGIVICLPAIMELDYNYDYNNYDYNYAYSEEYVDSHNGSNGNLFTLRKHAHAINRDFFHL